MALVKQVLSVILIACMATVGVPAFFDIAFAAEQYVTLTATENDPSYEEYEELAKNAWTDDDMLAAAERNGFIIDDDWHNWLTGLDAYGLVRENEALLVFRATEEWGDEWVDILSDLNTSGVGYNQYEANRSDILSWASDMAQDDRTISVTGHSLGGALAQYFATDWTSSGLKMDSLITFQSAGVSAETAGKFNAANCETVVHHIAAGDLVSLTGVFVQKDSDSYRFYTYTGTNANPFFSSIPLAESGNDGIYIDPGDVHSKYFYNTSYDTNNVFRYIGKAYSAAIGTLFNEPGFQYGDDYTGILSTKNLLYRCDLRLAELQRRYDARPWWQQWGDPSRFDDFMHMRAVGAIRGFLGNRASFEYFRKTAVAFLVLGTTTSGIGIGIHQIAFAEELSQIFGNAATPSGEYDSDFPLRQLIESASAGDVITFPESLRKQTIKIDSEIFIDKNIEIDATGMDITIDAQDKSRVFRIAAGVNVIIKGLTITGGRATTLGGGIYNNGNLTLVACNISGNEVIAEFGEKGKDGLNIEGGIIDDGKPGGAGGDAEGGGIYTNGTLRIVGGSITGKYGERR